jgi:ABC-type Na+ efflux pump permease subunit
MNWLAMGLLVAAGDAPTQSAATGGSGISHPWIWIVLGFFVLAAVAALIARYAGRRK